MIRSNQSRRRTIKVKNGETSVPKGATDGTFVIYRFIKKNGKNDESRIEVTKKLSFEFQQAERK